MHCTENDRAAEGACNENVGAGDGALADATGAALDDAAGGADEATGALDETADTAGFGCVWRVGAGEGAAAGEEQAHATSPSKAQGKSLRRIIARSW
ncbi:MAG: hypothetical protein IPM54_35360 [Polyangiaceae bacterium]|nr:hypothetical protein [Polyangiaceae bacterium]